MSTVRSKVRDPTVIAGVGGIGYAAVVLSYMFSRGVYLSFESVDSIVFGIGYAVGGLVLMAAVPLYLLARFSVVSPAGTTVWLLANTVYQDLYGAHLHPLTSYLTVWPLLFGVAIAAGLSEVLIRLATERTLDRGGFRRLV
jgi:membrane protease YdiL (CAAX protease family)